MSQQKTNRMRDRSIDPISEDMIFQQWNPSIGPSVSGSYILSSLDETMSDVVTKDYAKRIALGHIINNACYYKREEFSSSGGSYGHFDFIGSSGYFTLTGGSLTEKRAESIYNFWADISYPDKLDWNQAMVTAISNMDTTPYAFGEDVGEIAQTIKLVKNPFQSLAKLAKSFKEAVRKQQSGGLSHAKATAEVWTSYRFAFSPLVRSALDATEALTSTPRKRPPRLNARGFDHDSSVNSDEKNFVAGPNAYTFKRSLARETFHHAHILYKVTNPLQNLSWQLGLRPKDIPKTMWQLFPYSFMVDRVVDISSVIGGFTNLIDPRLKILASSKTIKREDTEEYQLVEHLNASYTITTDADTRTSKLFEYKRVPWSPSVSDLVPKVNTFGLVDSATKVVDLASLILLRLR